MSRYSGKCDFLDHLWCGGVKTEEEAFKKFNGTKLYIIKPLPEDFSWQKALEENINVPETYYEKIEYKCIEDLIQYYPYLISFAACTKNEPNNSVVCLSSKSFVDIEEEESLEFKLRQILKVYNRCKRKKTEFIVEDALKEICWGTWNIEAYTEIAKRVKEKGKKANIDGIHLTMHEIYRKELTEEMVKHNLNPKDYGYERFC